MMHEIDCTDCVYEDLIKTGLAERICNELPKVKSYERHFRHWAYATDLGVNKLRKLGKRICRALNWFDDEQKTSIDSLSALYLAVGAFYLSECCQEYSSDSTWRNNGKKTLLSSLSGERVYIEQKNTGVHNYFNFFVPGWQTRTLSIDWSYWPDFFSIALMYFHKNNPGIDTNRFANEHFDMWKIPFSKSLFAECLTDEEIAGVPEKPEQSPRLEHCSYRLKEYFSRGLPDASASLLHPFWFNGNDRGYYVFLQNGDLHFGIQPEHVGRWEDDSCCETLVKAEAWRKTINIRNWIVFKPNDSQHLLKACLEQYSRDRAQVPEIADFYAWGLDLEKQMEKSETQ